LKFLSSWGLAFFFLGVVTVIILQACGISSTVDLTNFKKGDTILVLAFLFLIAAAVESLVSVFNNLRLVNRHIAIQPFGDPLKLKKDEDEQRKRGISSWGLAGLFGTIFSYFTVGLLTLLGITISIPSVSSHVVDSIVTGLVLASGTKPFHDLVIAIEKQR